MVDWTKVERDLIAAVASRRRPVAVTFSGGAAGRRAGVRRTAAVGLQLLAAGRRGPALLHRARPTTPAARSAATPTTSRCPRSGPTSSTRRSASWSASATCRMEEVPGIPRLPQTPGAVVYSPLGETPGDPDVVLVAGRPGRLMVLNEAATRAGVPTRLPLLGRPTCMALPAALGGSAAMSLGCIGNRVYTGLDEDELYVALPGSEVPGSWPSWPRSPPPTSRSRSITPAGGRSWRSDAVLNKEAPMRHPGQLIIVQRHQETLYKTLRHANRARRRRS